ncbi:hypothetical protein D3C81_482610 [compost metagenome]
MNIAASQVRPVIKPAEVPGCGRKLQRPVHLDPITALPLRRFRNFFFGLQLNLNCDFLSLGGGCDSAVPLIAAGFPTPRFGRIGDFMGVGAFTCQQAGLLNHHYKIHPVSVAFDC